jgi:acetolactate synthase I/II/III large subunit
MLGLGMMIVVHSDAACGAKVHHVGPAGHPLSTVVFPDLDLAAIADGYGCAQATARSLDDLAPIADWLTGPR